MKFFWLISDLSDAAGQDRVTDATFYHSPAALTDAMTGSPDAIAVFEVLSEDDRDRAFACIEDLHCSTNVWIYEPTATIGSAVRWMKAGVAHVTSSIDEFVDYERESEQNSPPRIASSGSIIGHSRSASKIQQDIQMIANRRCNLLIEGETGTGKEVVARETHAAGKRSRGPWVAVNCGAIPEPLLEAELFGYTRGAFTGAVQARAGKFEAANHGTIFLDEIGDMPLSTQGKLLRVLQEREVERLGGNERIQLDVRVIAATNVDLAERVRQGLFRQDLFYRLNVFRIVLQPLRERPEDIAALANHFVDKVCRAEHFAPKRLDRSTLERLEGHTWPGNVRELENAIETAVIVSGDRATIFPSDLRLVHNSPQRSAPATRTAASLPDEGLDYQRTLEEFEKNIIAQALSRSRGNKTAAADLLRMKRTTLSARMRALETRLPRLVA